MPNTSETCSLVNREVFNELSPSAVFINPGRGNVVDEAALVDALTSGRIAGAVLDVFNQEPLPRDHPFWTTPRLLITSHTAALSQPSMLAPLFLDNFARFAAGLSPQYIVDFERGY
jgi:phosphoglycerate dehydrogenase-like enzyme